MKVDQKGNDWAALMEYRLVVERAALTVYQKAALTVVHSVEL